MRLFKDFCFIAWGFLVSFPAPKLAENSAITLSESLKLVFT